MTTSAANMPVSVKLLIASFVFLALTPHWRFHSPLFGDDGGQGGGGKPDCNELWKEFFPPLCGGTYTKCEDMSELDCPGVGNCSTKTGKYPESPPTKCESGTPANFNKHCIPMGSTVCYQIYTCNVDSVAHKCVKGSFCSVLQAQLYTYTENCKRKPD